MQFICNDKTVRSNTVEDLKYYNSQFLATQARKKREQLLSLMPAFGKVFDLIGDDTVEKYTKNESLKNKLGT